jgi:competence protein ComEC
MPEKMTLSQIFNPMFFSVPKKALLELKKTENEEEYLMKKGRLIFYFLRRFAGASWNLLIVSCTIWLITMPLILERFHLFTPVAVAVNPALCIPLTASMFFGFIAALCGQIPLIGSVSGGLADFSFWSLIGTVSFFQQLGGHYYLPAPPVWWNLVFYSVFCVFTFLPLQRPRRFVLFGLLAVWITVGFTSGYVRNYIRQSEDRLTLAVYAVGHGNGILITTPQNRLIVCDAGCIGQAKHAGNILSRAVWQLGKTHIDTIIVTHSDIDHFNGINRLLDLFSVGTVLISPYSEHPNSSQQDQSAWRELRKRLDTLRIPVRVIGSGDDLSRYGLPRSHILHPPKTGFAQPHKTNDCSIVLRFEHCGTSVMLTGDLDGSEPAAFLRTQPQHTDAVLVPHHGGKSGQTALLLDWATPQKLLVSAGSMTYRKEKMDDYRRRGFSVHNTYEGGAVILNITKDGWQ